MSERLSLDQLQMRELCHESWEAMRVAADGHQRHCAVCDKDVHDLSTMSRREVDQLLAGDGEMPCVRVARGVDGRVLTREDFERRPPSRRSWLRRAAAIAATLGIGSLFNFGCNQRDPDPVVEATGMIRQPMPATAPTGTVVGEVAPIREPPATRPSIDPALTMRTMGIVAEPPRPAPLKTKAATPKRGRQS